MLRFCRADFVGSAEKAAGSSCAVSREENLTMYRRRSKFFASSFLFYAVQSGGFQSRGICIGAGTDDVSFEDLTGISTAEVRSRITSLREPMRRRFRVRTAVRRRRTVKHCRKTLLHKDGRISSAPRKAEISSSFSWGVSEFCHQSGI